MALVFLLLLLFGSVFAYWMFKPIVSACKCPPRNPTRSLALVRTVAAGGGGGGGGGARGDGGDGGRAGSGGGCGEDELRDEAGGGAADGNGNDNGNEGGVRQNPQVHVRVPQEARMPGREDLDMRVVLSGANGRLEARW
ncbi:hypothetical protein GX51_03764 [Blastomyces parvus]|uniref:Uncharacterized protein n=1 Tax=Blastomyces parvus TaxID=2060905 RepID=A0A2B7X5I4_9EURO|nr:hypothetical protein GX51_03764 [Blastomyces parvus]